METERREERRTGGARAAGVFLLGAAAGIMTGLMLAPESGKETRHRAAWWFKKMRVKTRQFRRHAVEGFHPSKPLDVEEDEETLAGG